MFQIVTNTTMVDEIGKILRLAFSYWALRFNSLEGLNKVKTILKHAQNFFFFESLGAYA